MKKTINEYFVSQREGEFYIVCEHNGDEDYSLFVDHYLARKNKRENFDELKSKYPEVEFKNQNCFFSCLNEIADSFDEICEKNQQSYNKFWKK